MPFDLGLHRLRLQTPMFYVAAGAVIDYMSKGGDPATAALAASTSALIGVGSNMWFSKIAQKNAQIIGSSQEVFRNHHLTEVVGRAIGVVVRLIAEESSDAGDRKTLTTLADAAP
jgi:hypothetical protein